MQKKGLSSIIVSVLLILLSVFAVVIVWAVVSNVLQVDGELDTSIMMLEPIIKKGTVYIDEEEGKLQFLVSRDNQEADVDHLKFVVEGESGSLSYVTTDYPEILESKIYSLNIDGLTGVKKISVYAVSSSGKVSPAQVYLIDGSEPSAPTGGWLESIISPEGEGGETECENSETQECYSGEVGTAGVGICSNGVKTCAGGVWGNCVGEITPQTEECVGGFDEDCDGLIDGEEIVCVPVGLVSWWNFNKDSLDSVGDNDCSLENGAEIEDGVLKLEGHAGNPKEYADCGNDASLDMTNGLTMSAWVKFDESMSGPYPSFIHKLDSYWLGTHLSSRLIRGDAYVGGWGAFYDVGGEVMDAGTWYHAVTTYDGITQRLYQNGVLVKEKVRNGPIETNSNNLFIGADPFSTASYVWFVGDIDDVMIYDRALTDLEIAGLYDVQKEVQLSPIDELVNFDSLPYLKGSAQSLQYSSFDRSGSNYPGDGFSGKYSYLYKEGENFVIFDEMGPGAVYNLWMTKGTVLTDAAFEGIGIKFYFDDELVPRIDTTIGEFFGGGLSPFNAPLTENTGNLAGLSRNSFVPIPFKKRLKIVMDQTPYFYHTIYNKYDDSVTLDSFTGDEDYSEIVSMFGNKGNHPTGDAGTVLDSGTGVSIEVNENLNLIDYERADYNYISSIKVDPSSLDGLWIKMYWDGESVPSVNAPLGEFFGSGLGEQNIEALPLGMSTTGDYYCYFPMPFNTRAKIQIENKGSSAVSVSYEIRAKTDFTMVAGSNAGYFRANYNFEFPTIEDVDYKFLETTGVGHYVGVVHTMQGLGDNAVSFRQEFLEGDERFFIDGKLSPNWHGTGSEDYYLGAYYYNGKPYSKALSGVIEQQDANGRFAYTQYRFHLADVVPFLKSASLGMETGPEQIGVSHCWRAPDNPLQCTADASSVAFYYSIDSESIILTDEYDVAGTSQTFKYPGYDAEFPLSITDDGRSFINSQTEFIAEINSDNKGVVLRRRLDYSLANQLGDIYVDDVYVGKWYTAGKHDVYSSSNVIKWLDSDFYIPKSFTSGKSEITIRIESTSWNEYYYWIYSRVR